MTWYQGETTGSQTRSLRSTGGMFLHDAAGQAACEVWAEISLVKIGWGCLICSGFPACAIICLWDLQNRALKSVKFGVKDKPGSQGSSLGLCCICHLLKVLTGCECWTSHRVPGKTLIPLAALVSIFKLLVLAFIGASIHICYRYALARLHWCFCGFFQG